MLAWMLEDPSVQAHRQHVPHASLVLDRTEVAGLRADIWMGGAHSEVGAPLDAAGLSMSLVIDCAGDMPAPLRAAAATWVACVFADIDGPPMHYERIEASVRTAAEAARRDGGTERVVVLCTHGMNRSGLLTGLLLREFGLSGEAAIARIAAARPGALSNQAFRRIVLGL
jgi:hypothetical protein